MQAYSQDLRDRVIRALERGDRPSTIAERFEVSRVYVYDVKRRLSQGERSSQKVGGHRVSKLAPWEPAIRSWIAAQPDLTLAELAARLKAEAGLVLTPPAIWHQLNRWGLSFKKNAARRRAGSPGRGPAAPGVAPGNGDLGSHPAGLS